MASPAVDEILTGRENLVLMARLRRQPDPGRVADDLLTTLVLATDAQIALAPAMNQAMWRDNATQANAQALQKRGYQLFGRTIQVWNTWRTTKVFEPGHPWLLRFFDKIRFFPVDADELLDARAAFPHGQYDIRIEQGE